MILLAFEDVTAGREAETKPPRGGKHSRRMKAPRKPSAPQKGLRSRAEERLARTPREVAQMPVEDVQKLVHELQVHQIELEMQNDELRRAQLEMEAARDRYADLFDFAPTAFLTLDARGMITAANLAAGSLLGLARGDLIHAKFTRFIQHEAQDDFYLYQRRLSSSNAKLVCELELLTAQGRRLTVQLQGIASKGVESGKTEWRLALTDLTQRKHAEDALREASQFNQQIIAGAKEGIVVYGRDLRYLVWSPFMEEFTGVPAADVIGKRAVEVFPFLEAAGVIEQLKRVLAGKESATREFPFHVAQTGRSGWASDTNSPLRNAKGEMIGVIGIVSDITERKQTEERITQLNRIQAILGGVDRAILHIPDQQKLLDEICRVAVEKGGFELAWIGMVAPDGTVRPVAQAGATGYLEGIRVVTGSEPEGLGPVGTAIRENWPVVIEDIDRDARMAPWRERAQRFGLRHLAAFPIRISGKAAGAFQVYAPGANSFDENELGLLTQVSDNISFALTTMAEMAARKQAEEALRRSEAPSLELFRLCARRLGLVVGQRGHPAGEPGATGHARLH